MRNVGYYRVVAVIASAHHLTIGLEPTEMCIADDYVGVTILIRRYGWSLASPGGPLVTITPARNFSGWSDSTRPARANDYLAERTFGRIGLPTVVVTPTSCGHVRPKPTVGSHANRESHELTVWRLSQTVVVSPQQVTCPSDRTAHEYSSPDARATNRSARARGFS